MKKALFNSINGVFYVVLFAAATFVAACSNSNKYSFETCTDALKTCQSELSKIRSLESANVNDLADITASWLELQDSTVSCFIKDTIAVSNDEITNSFFMLADSFRTEITRLATSQRRTLPDILTIKYQVAHKTKRFDQENFDAACRFYDGIEKDEPYKTIEETLTEYDNLLNNATQFKKEAQLLDFIQKEDRCFRSLMLFLKEVPTGKLQSLTNKTSDLFENLYRNASVEQDNKVNERVMIYLTMRFNRRIVQNAETCRQDVKKKAQIKDELAFNYRWMLLQPYMTIDNYAMALLTNEQMKTLTSISQELPMLLTQLDGKDYTKATREETEKLNEMLCDYLLQSFLKTTL